MLEKVLTVLIAFVAPLPWWFILVHTIMKSSKLSLGRLAYLSIAPAWAITAYLAFTYQRLLFAHPFTTGSIGLYIGLPVLAAALVIDLSVIRLLGLRRLVGLSEASGERTSGVLVTRGIYRYARHPIYVAHALWSCGFGLLLGYPFLLCFAVYIFASFWLATYFEEAELIQRFGQDYREYQNRVPRFFV